MHDLTILSIFRNSAGYLDRYEAQVEGVLRLLGGKTRLVWLEGDSVDDTPTMLTAMRDRLGRRNGVDVTYTIHNHGGPAYPSIDDPARWQQLSDVWNRCLSMLGETTYAVCVESDLIWKPDALLTMLDHIDSGRFDVACPLLMLRDTDQFYDTHAFRSPDGRRWSAWPPYTPGWDGKPFVPVSQAGGMVVARGETMRKARWGDDDCVLHFPEGTRFVVDMFTRIRHP
jgi:hypothetical protein